MQLADAYQKGVAHRDFSSSPKTPTRTKTVCVYLKATD
jgi:hypothetical protein